MLTRDALYDRLLSFDLARPDAPGNRALEEALWAEAGRDRAVLVSDLSGFTRLTRSRGILHFLAVFERARLIGERTIPRFGGRLVKSAADNLFALFDEVGAAAACGQAMLAAAEEESAALAAAGGRGAVEAGQVRFCLGISCGRLLELSDDAFGDAVNVAFKLGEDIAEPGEILLAEPAAEALRTAPAYARLAAALQGPETVELGRVTTRFWRLPPG